MNLNLKIRTYKTEDPIAKYFCTIDHSMEHYKVIGIEKVHGDQILYEEKETL